MRESREFYISDDGIRISGRLFTEEIRSDGSKIQFHFIIYTN